MDMTAKTAQAASVGPAFHLAGDPLLSAPARAAALGQQQ